MKYTIHKPVKDILYQRIEETLYSVIKDREYYFMAHGRPSIEEVPKIIRKSSAKCATISGAAGLVPGALGMIACIPEIIALLKEQMKMIYDIGVAYDKKEILNPELLVELLQASLGAGTISMISIRGTSYLMRERSVSYLSQLIAKLGLTLSNRTLRAMISKWVPIAGAAVLAQWSKRSTKKIGQTAEEFFSNNELFLRDEEE